MTPPSRLPLDSEHAPTPRAYTLALVALLLLLAATVAVAELGLGRFALLAAMAIAAVKALIVALVFMELGAASATTRAALALGVFTVATLIGLSFLDWGDRNRTLEAASPPIGIRAREGAH